MTRKKLVVKKYNVSVNQQQQEALEKLMVEDMQYNVSSYFGMMIAEVVKGREGRKRGAVGRPKKEESDTKLAWYPCPYDETAPPYTMDDLEGYYTYRSEPVPVQPPAYSREQLKKWGM